MRFRFDRKYLKVCLYAFVTIAALLLFHRILQASDNVWQSVLKGFSFTLGLLSPFITAIVIAYILSPAVTGLQLVLGKMLRKPSQAKAVKFISHTVVYVTTVALLVLTLRYVIPGVVRNISELVRNWQFYAGQVQKFYSDLLTAYPLLASDAVQRTLYGQLDHVKQSLAFTNINIMSVLGRVGTSLFSFVIGLILSFYLLNEREHILESFEKLVKARVGEKTGAGFMRFLHDVDNVFGRYISAKLLICVVLFVICLVTFSLLHVHYLVLMCAVVALSTLVPYIGPFVGAAPPILISLLDSPQKAIYVGVSILAIHLVDGYFIEPYIFSDRMGLSPFWILLSIILGGGLLGFWGVLLAVPVAAVIKLLIKRYIAMRQARAKAQAPREETGGQP